MPQSHLQTVIDAVRAKNHLKATGYTYRTAAEKLGRSYQHLSDVLNGHRVSMRLIREVLALKPRKH